MVQLVILLTAMAWITAGERPPAHPTLRAPSSSAVGPPGSVPMPRAPVFRPGTVVSDRTGARVGVVESLAETRSGLNVVIEIDGKLIGVPPSTLLLRNHSAVSLQTREEILSTAGASH